MQTDQNNPINPLDEEQFADFIAASEEALASSHPLPNSSYLTPDQRRRSREILQIMHLLHRTERPPAARSTLSPVAETQLQSDAFTDRHTEALTPDPDAEQKALLHPELPTVPGYQLFEEVGRGGMGVVYRARHRVLNRLVAIKMILAADLATPEQVLRFQLEAELAARVRHPNVVQVHEIGRWQGRPFLALEWIEGATLAEKLREGPLSPREVAHLVEVLARAVHAAHCQGVIHRDLKPRNILLSLVPGPWSLAEDQGPGTRDKGPIPKITDFGLARPTANAPGLTVSGAAAACSSGDFRLWDCSADPPVVILKKTEAGRGGVTLAFSPDGDSLLTGGAWVQHWDAKTGKRLGEHRPEEFVVSVAFSPDGQTMFAGCRRKGVQGWSTATGQPIHLLPEGRIHSSLACRADGLLLLTGAGENSKVTQGGVRLWELPSGRLVRWQPMSKGVLAVAFSPTDADLYVTGGRDQSAQLWSVKTGNAVGPPMLHQGWVRSVAISPDGTMILTGSDDKKARLWDVATGKPLSAPLMHGGGVQAVAFHPNGKLVLTGDANGIIPFWEIPTPMTGAVNPIRAQVEFQTGLRMDSEGRIYPLEPEEWLERQLLLRPDVTAP